MHNDMHVKGKLGLKLRANGNIVGSCRLRAVPSLISQTARFSEAVVFCQPSSVFIRLRDKTRLPQKSGPLVWFTKGLFAVYGSCWSGRCWMLLVVVCKQCNNLQQCEQKPHTCTSRTMTHVHLHGDHIVMRVRGYNSVMLRFSDHGTKEMLGVVSSKVWLVSNVCKRTQPVTPNNIGSCCTAMSHDPFCKDL